MDFKYFEILNNVSDNIPIGIKWYKFINNDDYFFLTMERFYVIL